MRTALRPGTVVNINGIDYAITGLLSAGGGMSLIYEASQRVSDGGFAAKTVIKEFFPTQGAARGADGRVVCTSQEPGDLQRFEALRRGMMGEGIIGEDARAVCSQVYAFDHAWNGYAVMRELSKDTLPLSDILNAWQKSPPRTDEEFSDMARLRYALRIVHSLLTGLQTIHRNAGIIHRDISLGNVVWASADFEQDGRDGRACFLDFGSALRMDENREAQNVADPRDLYGTYSFAAPEIWTLGGKLTPAADLFSVSAVLLVLCCGKKCCIRMKPGWHLASQANVERLYESDYVVRTSLEKLNIPADIRGRLYDLLLEGLSREPAARFEGSALRMLEALETLQIKCAPRQRLREYAAFISYHHRPLDKAVARRLQQCIEQYVIPKELAGDRENRRLGLVFRDEDELPVSTDLTDNIQEALDHSDWLIVVCTPGTPQSIWVEQEIVYFLRHHDRNHLLAVLAEGRPEESFPPHLRYLYDAEGRIVGETEYLAANIAGRSLREVMRNLNRERFRIIAAMLGCPYDSLYQREKRRQIQRFASLACAGLVFSMFFAVVLLERNAQIARRNEQLLAQKHEIQMSESRLLVEKGMQTMGEGETASAMRYALAALPKDAADDRPVYAPAERLLLEATGILAGDYESRDLIDAVDISCDYPITQFEADASGTRLLMLDELGTLYGVDPLTGRTRWSARPSPGLDDAGTNSGSCSRFLISEALARVVCVHNQAIGCYNLSDGAERWRWDLSYPAQPVLALSEDGRRVALVAEANQRFTPDWDLIRDYDLVVLNMEDGQVEKRVSIARDQGFLDMRFMSPAYADGFRNGLFYQADRCFAGVLYQQDSTLATLYTVDLESETCRMLYSEPVDIISPVLHIGINPAGDGLLMLKQGENDDIAVEIACIGLDTGAPAWRSSVERLQKKRSVSGSREWHLLDGDEILLLAIQDKLYALDKVNGERLDAVPLYDALTGMSWTPQAGLFGFTLANGYYAVGWRSGVGLTDSKSYQLGSHTRAALSRGGFLLPQLSGRTVQGFSTGEIHRDFGYVVIWQEDAPARLRIRFALPSLAGVADETVLTPGDHGLWGLTQVDFPMRIFPDSVVIVEEKAMGEDPAYIVHCQDLETRAFTSWSYPIRSLDRLYPFAHGQRMMQVNAATGRVVVYEPEDAEGTTLAAEMETEISREYREDVRDEVIFVGYSTAASCAWLQGDSRLLTAWCDGAHLKWWLNGEEQPDVPLPESVRWQVHDHMEYHRWFQCGENGLIVMSDYAEQDREHMEGFVAYDTGSRQWLTLTDAYRGSDERQFAVAKVGRALAVLDPDGLLRIYDFARGETRGAIPFNIPAHYVKGMDFIMGDRYLLLQLSDDRLMILDPERESAVFEGRLKCSFRAPVIAELDAAGRRLFLIDADSGGGLVIDALNWTELSTLDAAMAYDGRRDELYFLKKVNELNKRRIPDLRELIDMAGKALERPQPADAAAQ